MPSAAGAEHSSKMESDAVPELKEAVKKLLSLKCSAASSIMTHTAIDLPFQQMVWRFPKGYCCELAIKSARFRVIRLTHGFYGCPNTLKI